MALLVFLNCCFGISAANGLGDEEEITEANEEEDKPKNERPPPALDEEKAAELFEVPNKFGDAAENDDENDAALGENPDALNTELLPKAPDADTPKGETGDKPDTERPPPALDEGKAAELFEVPNKFGDAAENADENDIEVPNKFAVENADENDIEVPNKFGDAVENADENNGYDDDDGGGVSADADFEDETGSVGDAVAMSLIAACWI